MKVQVGDNVPITAQLHDGNSAVEVTAVVKNKYGDLLARLMLISIGNGLYINTIFQMPDTEFILVQIETDRPEDYAIGLEQIDAVPKPSEPDKVVVGEVIGKIKSDDIIRGVVDSEKT